MKYITAILLPLIFASCQSHNEEVNDAVVRLDWLDEELDVIGERNIKGYKQFIMLKGYEEICPTDTIRLSVEEFHNIQLELYSIKSDLEELAAKMRKEYETE